MSNTSLLKYLNVILFFLVASQFVTGLFIEENAIEDLKEIHEICGYIIVASTIGHIWLNRAWIKNVYFKKKA